LIAALIKWGRHCASAFHCVAARAPQPHATRNDFNPTGLKPLSFWQSAAESIAAATAESFMASNATVASIAIILPQKGPFLPLLEQMSGEESRIQGCQESRLLALRIASANPQFMRFRRPMPRN
jgi:hypothetical protein